MEAVTLAEGCTPCDLAVCTWAIGAVLCVGTLEVLGV
jgi:hypothetical protein